MAADAPPSSGTEPQALLDALRAVLLPLARLAVARGLPYAALEEILKQVMIQAAAEAHPQLPPHRSVSRISTATGINRREVTRLTQHSARPRRRPVRSPANEVFTHWLASPAYRAVDGSPLPLPRLGPAPSFESLAQEVTRDVHPRSLLDELLRLQLASLDEATDTLTPRSPGFVPGADRERMLGFLADNVGDHLSGAVANVVGDGRRHFEQAIFADGLSDESLAAVRLLIGEQWKSMLAALVPPLERCVEADGQLPLQEHRRVRIGLYAYHEPTPEALDALRALAPPAAAPPRRRPRRS